MIADPINWWLIAGVVALAAGGGFVLYNIVVAIAADLEAE